MLAHLKTAPPFSVFTLPTTSVTPVTQDHFYNVNETFVPIGICYGGAMHFLLSLKDGGHYLEVWNTVCTNRMQSPPHPKLT